MMGHRPCQDHDKELPLSFKKKNQELCILIVTATHLTWHAMMQLKGVNL